MLLFPTHIFKVDILKKLYKGNKIYLCNFRESDTIIRKKFHDDTLDYYKKYLGDNKYDFIFLDDLTTKNKPDDIEVILDPVNKNLRLFLEKLYPDIELKKTPSFLLNIKTDRIIKFHTFYKKAIEILKAPFEKSYDLLNRETSLKHKVPNVKIKIGTTHEDAEKILKEFINQRLKFFGPYQDFIDNGYLFHSNISHLLNVGLLLPKDVIKELMTKRGIPINSREGFFRQLIWREYMKYLYEHSDFSKNIFEGKNKLSDVWWTADTKIDFIDDVIKQLNETGYNHHIQRLMIIGNSFLLLGIDPDEALKWFMMYIDAYDWVMKGNIVMALYTDDIFTKPYSASSNYIVKMSGKKYKRNEEFDLLYKSFIIKNYTYLRKHGRFFVHDYVLTEDEKKKVEEIKLRLLK